MDWFLLEPSRECKGKEEDRSTLKIAKKRCAKCGRVVDEYVYESYCDECAAEVWDAGFESTTQHADEIAQYEEDELQEIERMANKARVAYVKLADFVRERHGTWRCGRCNHVRIRSDQFRRLGGDKAKLVEAFKKPCPKCKVEGFLTLDY